jgi:hypothetical protein
MPQITQLSVNRSHARGVMVSPCGPGGPARVSQLEFAPLTVSPRGAPIKPYGFLLRWRIRSKTRMLFHS